MSMLIGIVEDELHIRQIIEAYLQKEGYRTISVASAEEALEIKMVMSPDLWILDIMLPGMDGYEFCRKIREKEEIPIIMISAKDEEVDRILGLEIGSDDYLTKPFSPKELIARVKRLLHRWTMLQNYQKKSVNEEEQVLRAGDIKLIIEKRQVFWGSEEVEVTIKEYDLLYLLIKRYGHPFSREEILHFVWGEDYFGSDRAVDDLVKRLRKKMTGLPLETVWGYGYRLREMKNHETAESN
ncbi:response regulator transcription factor [Cytobacillus dafuensis]|uniref:Response regulator transcription factor n=1 Tax=Cytobacillus dafuensis TaxID=1742359 RepID=A0A5B8Z287_CYTDA|nr:response regulator transcription factor [Cytobacillus dafuensis]QED46917.1 response regulator transcription factor [Cytobacillus dafuensis]